MAKINRIIVGEIPNTNVLIARQFVTFQPIIYVLNNGEISLDSHIIVTYKQYLQNRENELIEGTERLMTYVVANLPELLWEEYDPNIGNNIVGSVKRPAWNAFDNWFNLLDRYPIPPQTPGILDAIEATLQGLPIDVKSGYILQTSL